MCEPWLAALAVTQVTSAHIADLPDPFNQKQLELLAQTFPNLKELDIHQEYSDHSPELDFSKVKVPDTAGALLRTITDLTNEWYSVYN